MRYYANLKDRERDIKNEILSRREAAAAFPFVRKTIRDFDGKVYNIRFEKALQSALDGKAPGRIFTRNTGFRIEVNYYPSKVTYYSYFTLAAASYETEKKIGESKKKPVRIDAGKLDENLRAEREKLLKEAQEIEDQAPRMDEMLLHIKHAEEVLEAKKHDVHFILRDIYGIR